MTIQERLENAIPKWSERSESEKWNVLRFMRNRIMLNIEWIFKPSASITESQRDAGIAYFESLKNIPQDFETADSVVFPTPPDYLVEWINL